MESIDGTVDRLVAFTAGFDLGKVSDRALEAAKVRILDTLGCALGGLDSDPARIAREVATATQEGAVLWGDGRRVSLEDAAFANGVALRYLDFNDTYRAKDGLHPSDNIAALLAVAESRDLPGTSLLEGVIVSYEVQCRFADTVNLSGMGWDQPTSGVIAAALGVGRMLGFDEVRLAEAVSIAIVPHVPLHQARVPELTWWKGCAAAMGARNGLFAARLAELGMQGAIQPFEGRNGLWAQIGQRFDLSALGAEGVALGVQQTNIKMWPVRDSCQLAIETALRARAKAVKGGRAPRIAGVKVVTYASSFKNAAADAELWKPATRETADHSLPFCVAAAVLDGAVTAQTFVDTRFLDADVLGVLGSMEVEVSDDFTALAPSVRSCEVTITLDDGESFTAMMQQTQEQIEVGLPIDVVLRKFDQLAEPVLGSERSVALRQAVLELERVENVREIASLLVA